MDTPRARRALPSQVRLWAGLNKTKIRRKHGLLLAEGFKVVTELFRSSWEVQALLVREGWKGPWDQVLHGIPEDVRVYGIPESHWERLSQDKHSEGIMAVARVPRPIGLADLPGRGPLLLAYGVNNPNNLGAMMRTASWFGFEALLIAGDSVDCTNPKVVRTSMGTMFHLALGAGMDFDVAIPKLKKEFFLIAGDATGGVAPHPCRRQTALLVGSESHGLPGNLLALADERWSIPGAGTVESLSLPQASAIMMYAASQKMFPDAGP